MLANLGIGLEDKLRAKTDQLSGGQRQALAVLMATSLPPRLLLLDEHTAALDPRAAAMVMQLTVDLVQRQGLTTIMVTHNMDLALRWGDRLLMMHRGRIILDVKGQDKDALTVDDLLSLFHKASGEKFVDDAALLSG
jgi:putative ABC transport system ATP-binding protein